MSPKTPEQNARIRAESRQRIMAAAMHLFARDGYERTSIAGIAREAGVAKGLLYNYFSSKEDLLRTLILEAFSRGDEQVANLVAADPRSTLRNLLKWFFDEMRQRPEHWRLITEITLRVDKYAFVHELAKAKMEEYVQVLSRLFAQLNYTDPLNEARLFVGILDGIGVEALVLKEDYPLAAMEKFLLKKYCDENK